MWCSKLLHNARPLKCIVAPLRSHSSGEASGGDKPHAWNNIRTFIFRIGFGGMRYYSQNKEHPKVVKVIIQAPYIKLQPSRLGEQCLSDRRSKMRLKRRRKKLRLGVVSPVQKGLRGRIASWSGMCVCIYIYVHMKSYILLHTYIYIHACIHTCLTIYTYFYLSTDILISKYVYIYIYIYEQDFRLRVQLCLTYPRGPKCPSIIYAPNCWATLLLYTTGPKPRYGWWNKTCITHNKEYTIIPIV